MLKCSVELRTITRSSDYTTSNPLKTNILTLVLGWKCKHWNSEMYPDDNQDHNRGKRASQSRNVKQNRRAKNHLRNHPPCQLPPKLSNSTNLSKETTTQPVTLCLWAAWQPASAMRLWSGRSLAGSLSFMALSDGARLSLTWAVISLCKHVWPFPLLSLPF